MAWINEDFGPSSEENSGLWGLRINGRIEKRMHDGSIDVDIRGEVSVNGNRLWLSGSMYMIARDA